MFHSQLIMMSCFTPILHTPMLGFGPFLAIPTEVYHKQIFIRHFMTGPISSLQGAYILEPRVNRANFHWIIDILDQSIPLGMHCLEILSSNSYIRRSSVKAKNSKFSKSIRKARFWIRPRSKQANIFQDFPLTGSLQIALSRHQSTQNFMLR